MTTVEEAKEVADTLYQQKKCGWCKVDLKKRNRPPYTATRDGYKYFDYWQCPECKVNYAYKKEVSI